MNKIKQIWYNIKRIPFIEDNYERLIGQKKIAKKMQHQQEELQKVMAKSGFKKIREFVFEGLVTEQTYQVDRLTIDFFGQFYDGKRMIQYSYDKLDEVEYASNSEYSVYLVTLPKVNKTKYIEVDGVNVSVPCNAEEI